MASVRMTKEKARKYSFTGEQKPEKKPQKPVTPAQVTRTVEKPLTIVIPAVGDIWRVAKGLQSHFDNPPPVGSHLKIWCILKNCIFFANKEYSLSVTSRVLREYFEREETETP